MCRLANESTVKRIFAIISPNNGKLLWKIDVLASRTIFYFYFWDIIWNFGSNSRQYYCRYITDMTVLCYNLKSSLTINRWQSQIKFVPLTKAMQFIIYSCISPKHAYMYTEMSWNTWRSKNQRKETWNFTMYCKQRCHACKSSDEKS